MNKPINNKPTKNLDELLKELKNPAANLDAFEQEALDGFAGFGSEEEIKSAKKHLDQRFESEIMQPKKRVVFVYWTAAASIVLVLGLFFIFKNSWLSDSKSLALHDAPKDSHSQFSESTVSPAEESHKKEINSAINSQFGSSKSTENLNRSESAAFDLSKGPGTASGNSAESDVDAKSGASSASAPAPSVIDNIGGNNPGKSAQDDEAPASQNESVAEAKPDKKDENAKNKEESDGLNSRAGSESPFDKIKDRKKAGQAPAAKGVAVEPEGAYEKNNLGVATLNVSETELTNKINRHFGKPENRKAFICQITVNASGQVGEINFDDKKNLKKSEVKELEEFLKKLTCFKPAAYAPYSVYKLNYKAEK